jgi:hypothetical protein
MHRAKCLMLAALLAPFTLLAQTSASPIAGSWSGYIGRSEATPSAVNVDFKVAPDGAISGSVTGPKIDAGEIKTGTFDRSTGGLKFTVVVRSANNGEGGNVSFDGTLARDTIRGRMFLGGESGVFRFVRGDGVRRGTTIKLSEGAAEVKRSFIELSDWLTRAAELVPPDKYSYRPVGTVRTYGQLVGHIVDGSRYYCSRAGGQNVEWSDAAEKGVSGKPALVQALKKALSDCLTSHDGATQVGPLVANVAHSSLHYGNMITYIRMLGLVPPSS